MSKPSFKQFLSEAPIADYQTIGDFDKSYSFKKPVDRKLVTHPKAIEKLKQKFENTEYDFHLFMVNTREAKGFMELGIVKETDLPRMLGDAAAEQILASKSDDGINIIFTNNNGSEHIPMTPWIIAHRIGHAMSRTSFQGYGRPRPHFQSYTQAMDAFVEAAANILSECYGVRIAEKPDAVFRDRRSALFINRLFQEVCTFRSARNGNVRDWFEYVNELLAQWLTTNKGIQFNPAPAEFKVRNSTYRLRPGKEEDANDYLNTLANTMDIYFDWLMGEAVGQILLM